MSRYLSSEANSETRRHTRCPSRGTDSLSAPSEWNEAIVRCPELLCGTDFVDLVVVRCTPTPLALSPEESVYQAVCPAGELLD